MPLSPLEAANRINEQVTVEMLERAAKNCPHCSGVVRVTTRPAIHLNGLNDSLRGHNGPH
jgi:hypothetical protein